MISTTTFAISNAINFKPGEDKAHQKLLSDYMKERLKISAVKVLSAFNKIICLRRRNESPFIYIFWLREEILEFTKLRSLKIVQDLQSKPFNKLIYNLHRNLSIESDILIDNISLIRSVQELSELTLKKQEKISQDFEYLISFAKKLKNSLSEMNIVPLPPYIIELVNREESFVNSELNGIQIIRSVRKRTSATSKSTERKRSNLLEEKSYIDFIKKSPFRKKRIDMDNRLQYDIQDSNEIVKNLAQRSKDSRITVLNMKKNAEINFQRSTVKSKSRNFSSNLVSEIKQFASRESFEDNESIRSNHKRETIKSSKSTKLNYNLEPKKYIMTPKNRKQSSEDELYLSKSKSSSTLLK